MRPPEFSVHGSLYLPDDRDPAVAVVVIGGSGGSEPSQVCQALAAEGFGALSVAYFARAHLPHQLREIPLEYFFAAVASLATEPRLRDLPVVVVGMSRGSEAAMLTAIYCGASIAGVVAAVPGNVVLCSFPPGGPAWLLNGQALPYVSTFGPDCDNEDALIQVERVPGPLLLM